MVFLRLAKISLSPNLFPGRLKHSKGLLLAQSSLSIQYSTFQVKQVKSESCQLCLGGVEVKVQNFQNFKNLIEP